MNTFKICLGMGLFFLTISLTSCLEDKCDETQTFIQYEAVYKQYDEIRVPIKTSASKSLKIPGKMYFYENYIFINEIREGVHIIDNEDPSNPVNVGFIEIPGNVDIAIRNGIMYADNYMDVLSIDVQNPLDARLVERMEDIYVNEFWFDENRGVFVYYAEKDVSVEVDCSDPRFGQGIFNGDDRNTVWINEVDDFGPQSDVGGTAGGDTANVGTGGSFARFTISKDHLYMVDDFSLYTFKISDNGHLDYISDFYIGWQVETIFPNGEHLFMGTQSGMLIYSIEQASEPFFVSEFTHAQACDPVFVDGNKAYVTLRNGTACQNFTNQLDVVDITDLYNPTLIVSHEMQNPHGLSKRASTLYLCEGKHGLKVFDATEDNEIDENQLEHIKDFFAYDVISLSDEHILVIGDDGLYQFDTTDKSDLETISFIAIER